MKIRVYTEVATRVKKTRFMYYSPPRYVVSPCLISVTAALRHTNTIRVTRPKTTTIAVQSWVQLVEPIQRDACRSRHVVTINAGLLQHPPVAVGGYTRLRCARWRRARVSVSRRGSPCGRAWGYRTRRRDRGPSHTHVVIRLQGLAVGSYCRVPGVEVSQRDRVCVGNGPAAVF